MGKYEKEDRLITALIKDKVKEIHDCYFSYCHVDDFVKIVDWFIKNDETKYEVYNIGGTKIKLSDIAKKLGKKVKVINDGLDYTCDDSRLRKELKFEYSDFDRKLKEYQKEVI